MIPSSKCVIILSLVVPPSDLVSGGQIFLLGGRRRPRSLLLASTGPFAPTVPSPGGLPPRPISAPLVIVDQSCLRPRSGCLAAGMPFRDGASGPPSPSCDGVSPSRPRPDSLFAPGFNEGSHDLKRVRYYGGWDQQIGQTFFVTIVSSLAHNTHIHGNVLNSPRSL